MSWSDAPLEPSLSFRDRLTRSEKQRQETGSHCFVRNGFPRTIQSTRGTKTRATTVRAELAQGHWSHTLS